MPGGKETEQGVAVRVGDPADGGTEERLHARGVEHLGGAADADGAPSVEEEDAVGVGRQLEVVGGEDGGGAAEQVEDGGPAGQVLKSIGSPSVMKATS
jgi:hypothetical protein